MFKVFINCILNKLIINRVEFVHTKETILSMDIQGVPKRSGYLNISGNISFTEKCFRQKLNGLKISIY